MTATLNITTLKRGAARDLERELRGISRGFARVQHNAVRRSITTVRTRIVRAVGSDLNIKKSALYQKNNNRRPIRQSFERSGGLITGGRVNVTGRRIPLGRFKPTQLKSGVSYKVQKGGARKKITDGAFKATMQSGYEGVFMRAGESRLPLIQLYGPSVPQVAENRPEVQRLMQADTEKIFLDNLRKQADGLLKRGRARG